MQTVAKEGDLIKSKSDRNILLLYIATLCIVIIGLYSGITNNSFVDLDDTTLIVKNYPFLKDFSNAQQAFKQGVFQVYGQQDTLKTYYRPVVTLSFMVDAHLSPASNPQDISPKPFLRANIFYHIVACILLFLLLIALKINPFPSFLLSLLFAVHPILTQAIAWVPGRNDPLVAISILSAMLCLIKYTETKKSIFFVSHFLFFTLALFTKENAIMLIFISAFYLYKVSKEQIAKRHIIILLAGYSAVIAVWYFLRNYAIASSGPDISLGEMLKNIVSNRPMFFQYIGKSVIPYGLSVLSTIQDTHYILGILAILILTIGILLSKGKKWPLIIFGLLWFFLFLTPSFITLFSGLEHRAYLPLMGLIITTSEWDAIKKLRFPKSSPLGEGWEARRTLLIMGALIVTFMFVTHKRLPAFNNCYSFDTSAMETSPHNVSPCLYLAKHYEEAHEYNKAIEAYSEALKRDSTYPQIHNNIGGEYIALHKYPEAETELKKEIAKYSNSRISVFNLGLIYYTYGRDSEAVVQWKQAMKIDPGFMSPYKMLAEYYTSKGDSLNAAPYEKWLKEKGYAIP